jgi:hypothetical protein
LTTFFATGPATFGLTRDEAFGIAPLKSFGLVIPKKLATPVLLWLESRTSGPGGALADVLRAVAVDGAIVLLASIVGANFVVGLMSEAAADDWNPRSNPQALPLSLLLIAAFDLESPDATFAACSAGSVPTLRISAACVGVGSEALGFAGGEGFWLLSASFDLAIPKKLPIPEPLWLESRES